MHDPRASDGPEHAPIGETGGQTPHAGERVPSGGGKPTSRGDEAAPGTPGTGEALCRRCGGKGRLAAGEPCPECGGTGKVTAAIGGA